MSDELCKHPYESQEGLCDSPAKYSDGKCGKHTEIDTEYQETRNTNEKHGLHKSEYYEEQPEADKEFINAVASDLLDKSYYSEEDDAMVEKCRQVAIDIHQKRRADGYIAKKGMTQENTVGVHEQYGEITETTENTLFITKDRLSRESRLTMKDLGILDQDSGKAQQNAESLIESLSNDME